MVAGMTFDEDYIDTCLTDIKADDFMTFSFPDVPEDAWFTPSICALYVNGIVSGYPDGRFRPEEGINFAEASKMLSLAFGLTGIELPNFGATNVYWYEPYIAFLEARNAIPMTIEALNLPVNRGEVAEMIYRLQGYPVLPPPVELRESKSRESVAYPVAWQEYENYDYTFALAYPNVWPAPHNFPRGQYDGRIPYRQSSWTVYFGPETGEVMRDIWVSGYPVEDADYIVDLIEEDEYFVELEAHNIINKMPTMILLEEVGDCIDKRSFHFGKRWVYSLNIRCAGQDETLYRFFEQMVKTIQETDEVPPEHRN